MKKTNNWRDLFKKIENPEKTEAYWRSRTGRNLLTLNQIESIN